MKLSLVQNNGGLDPVSIGELATVMAERAWVDMRVVPGGIAERVRVVALLIRRDEEEVELEQWIADGEGEIEVRKHWVHAEEIWWVKPTTFEAGDDLRPFEPKGERQSKDNAFDAAVAGVAFYSRVTPEEVAAIAKDRLDENMYRYWIMLVYKELVNAKDSQVTGLFGYNSIQPLVSARDHAKKHNATARISAMVKHAKGQM